MIAPKVRNILTIGLTTISLGCLAIGCGEDSDDEETASTTTTTTGEETEDEDNFDGSGYKTTKVSDAQAKIDGASQTLKTAIAAAPTTFAFTNSSTTNSSVSYTGQTFRQVLNDDLKAYIGDLTMGGSSATKDQVTEALNSYYNYSSDNSSTAPGVIKGTSAHGVTAKDKDGNTASLEQGTTYDDIQSSGKNLQSKIAGKDNGLRNSKLLGWAGVESPDALVATWFDAVAANATGGSAFDAKNGDLDVQNVTAAYVTAEGLNYRQLIQKFIHGAVSFSQAAGDYLSTDLGGTKGLNGGNDAVEEGKEYTALEHHWDEGFGYFGAARDYNSYTDAQIKAGASLDTDSSGKMDILSEKNFGLSVNAAKRDVGAKDGKTDLSKKIMDGFLQGRHLISTKPEGYKEMLPNIAIVLVDSWEKTIAATVVHYINDVLKDMEAYGTADYKFTDHAKHWGELKGFALAFQFNPNSPMTIDGFKKFHELVGDKPVLGSAAAEDVTAYKSSLKKARKLLQDVYEFSADNAKNW